MEFILLLLNPLNNPVSANAAHPASISQSAAARMRRLLRDKPANFSRITELRVSDTDLARARSIAASHGSMAEVIGTAEIEIANGQGGRAYLSLSIQCTGTGPVHVTTYDEWASLP